MKGSNESEPMTQVPIRNIVFVDVDGVFNQCDDFKVLTVPAYGMWSPWVTDLNKVELFNGVLRQAPDTRMVISSTTPPSWCYHVDMTNVWVVSRGYSSYDESVYVVAATRDAAQGYLRECGFEAGPTERHRNNDEWYDLEKPWAPTFIIREEPLIS